MHILITDIIIPLLSTTDLHPELPSIDGVLARLGTYDSSS